jgi:CRISPR-associated endoribonuclease Cas6
MRISLTFILDHEKITKDFHAFLMSYFKFALSKEYFDKFETMYIKTTNVKPFSFSTYIKDLRYEGEYAISPTKVLKMYISSNDYNLIMLLYNSILINKNRKMPISPLNSVKLDKITVKYLENIETNSINIKFLSPLLLRLHDRNSNKDYYITCDDSNFNMEITRSIKDLCTFFNINCDTLEIENIALKKVVVKNMRMNFDATAGKMKIKSSPEVLNLLYKIGIGSRRNQGFGLFEIDK